jgi:Zn-finger nucleic acid-binding protein/ribosomal protein L40E
MLLISDIFENELTHKNMASCKHCGAPLPANINKCSYCGTRNDVDLHAKHPYALASLVSNRICPNCDIPLQTIKLKLDEDLFIERCETCFGLFFDRGEIETVLQNSVSHVHGINLEHIDNINKDRYLKPNKIEYVKCPECSVLMNRVNFGHRSGVVVDQCIMHGIWLDSGELIHLLEWKKAGGQLLHEQTSKNKEKPEKRYTPLPGSVYANNNNDWDNTNWDITIGVATALAWLVGKFFGH